MKARKLFRASSRTRVIVALGVLLIAASAFAITVTQEIPLPGGTKLTVTSVGPKGGSPDHQTFTVTTNGGNKLLEVKTNYDHKGGTKSKWTQYDGNGKAAATGNGESSSAGAKSVTKDLGTGTKTTTWTKLDNNGQKTESGTKVEPQNGNITNSVTIYQNGKPSVTTTTNSNPYTSEEQHWDKGGKQVGGSLEKGGEKYQFDPKTGTYGDPSKTAPVTPGPPSYSRLAITSSDGTSPALAYFCLPPIAPSAMALGPGTATPRPVSPALVTALQYINSNLAASVDEKPAAQLQVASPPRGAFSGAGLLTTLSPTPPDPSAFEAEHFTYRQGDEIYNATIQNSAFYYEGPHGGWIHIQPGSPDLYYETPQGGWSQVYPHHEREAAFDFSGLLGDQSALPQLFSTGFDVGAGANIIFGTDPRFLMETHHHIVHGHTWKTERTLVGEETVDADGIPGGPDILVPVFKDKHVRVDTTKTVTTHTKKDISVVEDGDVGGNLNAHYWINRYFGIEVFNTILSAPGGTVDILGGRAEARLPFACRCCGDTVGVAPFIYLGCSGTMGGYEDLFGLDIGGGFQVRTISGFNISVEAGADLNGTQNYGVGAVNFGWHRDLLP